MGSSKQCLLLILLSSAQLLVIISSSSAAVLRDDVPLRETFHLEKLPLETLLSLLSQYENQGGKLSRVSPIENQLKIDDAQHAINEVMPNFLPVRSKRSSILKEFPEQLIVQHHQSSSADGEECGMPSLSASRLLGSDAGKTSGRWPWMAYFSKIMDNGEEDVMCGGVLISDRHILTAAHCFNDMWLSPGYSIQGSDRFYITLGLHNKSSPEPHTIKFGGDGFFDIFIHEKFNRSSSEYDIALVKLNRKIDFNYYIRPICLPPTSVITGGEAGDDKQMPFNVSLLEGETAYLTGWGNRPTDEELRNFPEVLTDVPMPVINLEDCKRSRPSNVSTFPITDLNLCAGGNGLDACEGDSGGPLMYQIGNKWTIIGIVSWGSSCLRNVDEKRPGVYTAVHSHVSWVQEIMSYQDNMPLYLKSVISQIHTQQADLRKEMERKAVIAKMDLELAEEKIESLNEEMSVLRGHVPGQSPSGFGESVHFDAFRNSSSSIVEGKVTYDGTIVNVGESMNPSTGIFSAPASGVYLFSFTTIKPATGKRVFVSLKKNINETIASSVATGDRKDFLPISLLSIVELERGDEIQIDLKCDDNYLYDSEHSYTHFSGTLLR